MREDNEEKIGMPCFCFWFSQKVNAIASNNRGHDKVNLIKFI